MTTNISNKGVVKSNIRIYFRSKSLKTSTRQIKLKFDFFQRDVCSCTKENFGNTFKSIAIFFNVILKIKLK